MAMLAAMTATGADPSFKLGVDYSQRLGFGTPVTNARPAIATDGTGALYLLDIGIPSPSVLPATAVLGSPAAPASYVMKLSPGGDRIIYLTLLDFRAEALAVDSSGSVYVAGSGIIAKLNVAGSAFIYRMSLAEGLILDGLAADNFGHAFVTGHDLTGSLKTTASAFQRTAPRDNRSKGFVAKVNTAGTGFDFATYLAGNGWDIPGGLAVDGTGAVVVAGTTTSTDFPVTPGAYLSSRNPRQVDRVPFLTRVAADGSKLIYSTIAGDDYGEAQAVAVDPSGAAAVLRRSLSGLTLMHFNPQGTAVTFSRELPPFGSSLPSLGFGKNYGRAIAIDAAGKTFVAGLSNDANYPVKNSLAPCESVYLTVLDPLGDLLQSTYLAGGSTAVNPELALGPNTTVFVAATFRPSRETGTGSGPLSLMRLSPNAGAQPVKLACVGNAASYDPGPVAPGEIVSLFGAGLGPAQGVLPEETTRGFPTELAGVQVTFDGSPAPLLYVQDGQVNAIAPWSLTAGQTTQICVIFDGLNANCVSRAVASAAPGVFTLDGRHAAAVNQDGTINSPVNPAPFGSYVSIFATGLGPLAPVPKDGAIVEPPLPALTLPVRLGFTSGSVIGQVYTVLDLQYVGPAPFQVAGVTQINFPATAAPLMVGVGSDFWLGNFLSRMFTIYVKQP
jgi:uncharacterized protein (TIGR03437 family)